MAQPPRPTKFQQNRAIVTADGKPTAEFLRNINASVDLTNYLADIQAQVNAANAAAAAANAAAVAAQATADMALAQGGTDSSEQSLVSSGILPRVVVTANSTGDVIVAAHTRYYGDGTNVSVDGGGDSGYMVGDNVYVSYIDPTRAGGAVVYEFAPIFQVQGNDRHVVGSVTIPSVGLQQGTAGPAPPGGG